MKKTGLIIVFFALFQIAIFLWARLNGLVRRGFAGVVSVVQELKGLIEAGNSKSSTPDSAVRPIPSCGPPASLPMSPSPSD
jgi:hypothetical protein